MAEAATGRALTTAPSSLVVGARLGRKLTVEEAARRAGLTAEEVEWLEQGRVYRFRTTEEALATAVVYRIHHVGRANRFDYPRTAVYYEPGGQPLAVRLARQIGVVTLPLPNGRNPRRLVVIVGPHKGPG